MARGRQQLEAQRFHPGLQQVARLLAEGAIGRPLSVRANWGEYLPGWHPWEDYRQAYSARPDLVGPSVAFRHSENRPERCQRRAPFKQAATAQSVASVRHPITHLSTLRKAAALRSSESALRASTARYL